MLNSIRVKLPRYQLIGLPIYGHLLSNKSCYFSVTFYCSNISYHLWLKFSLELFKDECNQKNCKREPEWTSTIDFSSFHRNLLGYTLLIKIWISTSTCKYIDLKLNIFFRFEHYQEDTQDIYLWQINEKFLNGNVAHRCLIHLCINVLSHSLIILNLLDSVRLWTLCKIVSSTSTLLLLLLLVHGLHF